MTFDLAKREGPIYLAQDEGESQAEKTLSFPHIYIYIYRVVACFVHFNVFL